jgi:hypothetical protein
LGKGKPRSVSENDGKVENDKVRSLKRALSQRDKEIVRLKQELKTLNKAFEKSAHYMSSQSKDLTVEELIKAAEKGAKLVEIKDNKKVKLAPPSQEEIERKKQETRDKIKKWRIETLGEYEED